MSTSSSTPPGGTPVGGPTSNRERIVWIILVVGLAAVVVFAVFSKFKPLPRELARLGPAPAFTLTTQTGDTLSDHDLRGKVWMADFMFTRCRTLCPVLTMRMKELQEGLGDRTGWALVSFSVDPEHDSPEVLNAYAEEQGADTEQWSFLTGDKQAIYDLSIKGFHLGVDEEGGDDLEPILHSRRIILVDGEGEIRGYYNVEDDVDMKALLSDAKHLIEAASP